MDDRRFDALVRSFASGQSRRSVLKGLLGLGGLAAGVGVQTADAARRPAPTPTPAAPKCPGRQSWNGSACACPSGSSKCGAECCDTGMSVCCDNACCHGECYGEELCCPTGQVVCDGSCCPPGEVCFEGACRRCTLCGDDCCSGDTPQCCVNDQVSVCTPAGATCCTTDSDCRGLGFCDGLTAHTFTCVNAVCTESTQSCQGNDPCYTYTCDQGVCGSTRNPGCCTSSDQCTAVDTCTPAQCLENDTCNAVSKCISGQHCCNGVCASTDDRCCTADDDCYDLDFCDDSSLDAYRYTCANHVCTSQVVSCQGDDPCVHYFCGNGGVCVWQSIPGCCQADEDCDPPDACTPARCLENETCNTVSSCSGGETCCADGACSSGGSCVRGCIIEGVLFPPCVTGCNICVAPDGGTLCGCAVSTTQRCSSSDICKELFGSNSICAGPAGSALCVTASGPLN